MSSPQETPNSETRRIRAGFALMFVLALGAALLMRHAGSEAERNAVLHRRFPIMGTVAEFTFYGPPEKTAAAADAARAEFDRVTAMCDLRNPASELSRLNASADRIPFVCGEAFWALMTEARQAYELSDGAFDVSAKPLMDLWGFYRERGDAPPSETEIAEARARVGLEKVRFDEEARSVFFTVPGMGLDFGGIAKGYAVDCAAEAAEAAGITRGAVDLGGNLRLLPDPPPDADAYRIGIRDPERRGEVLPEVLNLTGAALSTSGDYERFVTLEGSGTATS